MGSTFTKIQDFCLETNHPYIQIFYFVIGPIFYVVCCLLVLSPKIDIIGTNSMYVCHTLALFGFYNYLKAWLVNPGYIGKENEEAYIEKYKAFYDTITFKANNKCATCQIIKLAKKTSSIKALQYLQ